MHDAVINRFRTWHPDPPNSASSFTNELFIDV